MKNIANPFKINLPLKTDTQKILFRALADDPPVRINFRFEERGLKVKTEYQQFTRALLTQSLFSGSSSPMEKIFSTLGRVVMIFLTLATLMLPGVSSAKIISPDWWAWQNPLPQGNDLNGVWGSASNDVFAVGAAGTVLHYDGTTWASMSSGTANDLYGVWGSASNDVFAVGAAGTVLHYDGSTWSNMDSTIANDLHGVWGSASNDVFAVGAGGTILHYDGIAWSSMSSGTANDLYGVWGRSSTDVFAVGDSGTILHYEGSTWSAMTVADNLRGVCGSPSTKDVFAVGFDATIWHFDGTTWSNIVTYSPIYFPLYGIWCSSPTDLYVVGTYGVWHYDGSFWDHVGPQGRDVWGSSSTDVFVVAANGGIAEGNANGFSSPSGAGTLEDLRGVWGSSSSDVFLIEAIAAGEDFAFTPHYDGINWDWMDYSRYYSQLQDPRGIWGSSPIDVVAVGTGGLIAHYDGTPGWKIEYSNTPNDLYGVWGSAPNDVFAVGAGGTILHYDGIAWSNMDSTTANDLYGVWGSAPNDVFAVGAGGTVLHYDGNTWSNMDSNTPNDLYGVWGSSSNDVFAVGGGTILHYDGNTWSNMDGTIANNLYGVWGSASNNVFTVGEGGTILHYDGNTWASMSSGTANDLYGVWSSSPTDVFAVGANGTLLHYEPPTAPTNPVPTTTSISPTTEPLNAPGFTITVNGSNFISGSSVRFNGSGRPTTYISSTQLTALIQATDLTSAGTLNITVFNPSPGGGISNPQSFTVSQASTSLSIAPASGTYGGTVTLIATLTSGGFGVSGKTISFSLNGTAVGTAITGGSGVATVTGISLGGVNLGTHPGYIGATFAGDANYTGSSGSGDLTVSQASTSISIASASGTYGGTVTLIATLTSGGFGVSGNTISFSLNGMAVGTAITDGSGKATLTGVSLSGINAGLYLIVANFAGDANYTSSSSDPSLLTVSRAPTSTIATNVVVSTRLISQVVTLTATVNSPAGTVNTGAVTFTVWDTFTDRAIGTPVTGAVTNGIATASFAVPPGTDATWWIRAAYSDGVNFAGSGDGTHYLRVIPFTSDLAIEFFGFPHPEPIDPSSINLLVQVRNLIGSPIADDVTVGITWTDPTSGEHGSLTPQNLGELYLGQYGYATFSWSITNAAKVIFHAYVYSASNDPDQSNNQADLELDGVYFTDKLALATGLDYTFRVNRDGYSFANRGGSVDWSMFEETFGADNVDNTCFACSGVKPIAQSFYENIWGPVTVSGNCFGMAATSLEYWEMEILGELVLQGGTYSLTTDYTRANQWWRSIEELTGTSLGYQVLSQEVMHFSDDPITTLLALKAQMKGPSGGSSSDPNILMLFNPNSAQGHAVVPYRIVQTPVEADIYVYDPDYPYGAFGLLYPDYVVSVNLQSNTWSYSTPATPNWGGSWGLSVVPISLTHGHPTLPYQNYGSAYGLFLDFVNGAGHLGNENNTGQILGYLNGIFAEACVNVGMTLMSAGASSTSSSFPEAYVMKADEYVTTLSGTGTGSATATLLHSAAALTFTSPSITSNTQDTIAFSQDGNTATLGTSATTEHYWATLFHELTNSTREYGVSNTIMAAGEQITLAATNGGNSFEFVNQGKAKTYDLTLAQVGPGAATNSLTGLTVGAGETEIITVNDWTNLSTAEVDVQVKNSQGSIVSTKALQITFIDARRKTQLTINALDKLFRFLAPGFDSGVINAPKMRVINIDRSNPSAALIYNYQTRTWHPNASELGVSSLAAGWIAQCQFKEVPKEVIIVPYEDANILLFAVASHSTTDTCVAFLLQKSTGKVYLLIETASNAASSGSNTVSDGFWNPTAAVQTTGAPALYITGSGSTLTVHWQDVSGWTLQQNSRLTTPAGWTPSSGVTNSNGTNYLSITPSTGNLFFRLSNP